MTRFLRAVTAVALVFALGACAKVDIRLRLHGDNVDGTIIMGLDKRIIEQSDRTEEEILNDLTSDVPDSAKIERHTDDRFIGVRATLTNVSLSEFTADEVKIVHDKDAGVYTISGAFDLSGLSADANPDVRMAIDFPGRVIRHNGQLEGRTVTWVGKAREKLVIDAVAEDGGSGGNALLIALAFGLPLLALAGGAAFFLIRRNRTRPPPHEETAVPTPIG